MSWLPDDVREASGGEVIDQFARDAVRLAHRALDRFPELVKRHRYVAGGAAVSSALVVLAGVAVARRIRRGESPEDAVNHVTEEELLAARDLSEPPEAPLEQAPEVGGEFVEGEPEAPETDAEQGPRAVAQQAAEAELAHAAADEEPAAQVATEGPGEVEAPEEQAARAMARDAGEFEPPSRNGAEPQAHGG